MDPNVKGRWELWSPPADFLYQAVHYNKQRHKTVRTPAVSAEVQALSPLGTWKAWRRQAALFRKLHSAPFRSEQVTDPQGPPLPEGQAAEKGAGLA